MAYTELQPMSAKPSKHKLHAALHMDMTPLVDLGFLLITFFIFTTTMSIPRSLGLIMPAEGGSTNLAESKALTLLLGSNDQVYAYEGSWENALRSDRIIKTGYAIKDGIGRVIRAKQNFLARTKPGGREELVLIIKPGHLCSYKNFIDALDETIINDVKKYVVDQPGPEEKQYLEALVGAKTF